ncbi:hypothetical protein BOTBODRAFT_181070 [Botryobasidium botryosum FD-172 SS1]|uniref:Uncharacterized protein n=1 Tax=Botryobasidium botryosum (strain FD-172 SS1) TaxID=930990 RepID=A0A067M554_BOTB1|nr:hypothetical protein BOTBODRAFT_181070 [Botryobasidium botryosum FD-172 SS1]
MSPARLVRAAPLHRYPCRFAHSKHRPLHFRLASTSASPLPSRASVYSHLLAGAVGGGVVIAAAYTWYHFSGLKSIVATSQSIHSSIKNVRATFFERAPERAESSPAVLQHLRSLAKAYASVYPGGSTLVDKAFDSFDELVVIHGDKVNDIAGHAYADLGDIVASEASNDDKIRQSALVVKRASVELAELGNQVRHQALNSAFENHPELRKGLEETYSKLIDLAESGGFEAKRAANHAVGQLQGLLSQSISPDSVAKARDVIASTTSEVRTLLDTSDRDTAADAGVRTRAYLDQIQEIPDRLKENGPALRAVTTELFGRGKEAVVDTWGKGKGTAA